MPPAVPDRTTPECIAAPQKRTRWTASRTGCAVRAGRAGGSWAYSCCRRFRIGDFGEYFFQCGLQRCELFQLPALLLCHGEQHALWVVVRCVQHAELRGGKLFDTANTSDAFQDTERRGIAQADDKAGYAPILLHVRTGVAVDQSAVVHDLHAVADAFHFAEQMRGEDHAAVIAQFADQGAYLADLCGVETDRGFIQHDHGGTVD